MLKKYVLLVFLVFLTACGAESNDSTVVTPSDTISSTASVRFNANGSTLTVLDTGPDPQSDLFEVCAFTMDAITGTLSYALVGQNKLELGEGSFDYKRALRTPQTKAGVEDRVFSVWGTEDTVKSGVTLSFELEVDPDLLTFRMICNG